MTISKVILREDLAQANTHSRKAKSRAELIEKALLLRAKGLNWTVIATRLGTPRDSLYKLVRAADSVAANGLSGRQI